MLSAFSTRMRMSLSVRVSVTQRYLRRNVVRCSGSLHEARRFDEFPKPIRKAASELEDARSNNYQIQPLIKSMSDLDQRRGYEISSAIRALRESRGDIVRGRKIGFTNRSIWPEYGVDCSNWSYLYDNTIIDMSRSGHDGKVTEVDLSRFSRLEPKIEPEIVVGLCQSVEPGMTDLQILDCVDWVAHGFEVVISIFPQWKFTAADTTAAFALHGCLMIGPKLELHDQNSEKLLDALPAFEIDLIRNEKTVDSGMGSNVLGGPLQALRHLAELLVEDDVNLPLAASEVITTGTLTRALNIADGDVWSTRLKGIGLPGLQVRFKT